MFGKKRKIQDAVDSYVRAWLCSLTFKEDSCFYHLGEFAEVDFYRGHPTPNRLKVQGKYITPAAYEGLWVVCSAGKPQMFDKSGYVELSNGSRVRIYTSQDQTTETKPIQIRSRAE